MLDRLESVRADPPDGGGYVGADSRPARGGDID